MNKWGERNILHDKEVVVGHWEIWCSLKCQSRNNIMVTGKSGQWIKKRMRTNYLKTEMKKKKSRITDYDTLVGFTTEIIVAFFFNVFNLFFFSDSKMYDLPEKIDRSKNRFVLHLNEPPAIVLTDVLSPESGLYSSYLLNQSEQMSNTTCFTIQSIKKVLSPSVVQTCLSPLWPQLWLIMWSLFFRFLFYALKKLGRWARGVSRHREEVCFISTNVKMVSIATQCHSYRN